MIPRFAQFPKALAERTRRVTLAGVPAIIAHPDWATPAPTVIWMHGRTVSKEIDPGRYLRWIRAGIAAVALDLPGHGERFDAKLQHPDRVLDVVERMLGEIDHVIDALAAPEFERVVDLERLGVGGMSAGGMVTLRRLCEGHDFVAAAVEGTTGWLERLFGDEAPSRGPWNVAEKSEQLARLDPVRHLAGMRPVPMLLLSTTTDRMVPYDAVTGYLDAVRAHYAARGADPGLIRHRAWANTGAPDEHAGFGRFGNDAKNEQTAFLQEVFRLPGRGERAG
ncbi:MAG: hypothetical protein HBSAPP03_27360 [Phycisphaerae bacterium]|nr:MAG: hypothetical protein HBSAPP03_27360 [Phycisphaerae bacterium]